MKKLTILFLFLQILIGACTTTANQEDNATIITPESQGISSKAILSFIEAAEKERPDDLHSFMLLRRGNVIAQGWWAPYGPESPHMLYSLSKSFTSTAIGIAQSEGLLSIDDPVISFFSDETPDEPSDNLKAMRIRDLLKMNTGHDQDATGRMRKEGMTWVEGFLSLPVEHKPGTHFVYNSAATYMLSAIIQKITGQTLLEYLTPRLFEPLEIGNPTWETNADGVNMGGWGLNIRTKDIASFGQLYLQKGNWKGKQLIPEEWVREATSFQTSNGSNPTSDWEQGYGYQFWMCRHSLYRGDGAFGQYCIVMPEQEAVLAITSGTKDMQAIMNLAWTHLLPALQGDALPEDEASYTALQNKLGQLKLSAIEGRESSPLVSQLSGKTFLLEENSDSIQSISFDFNNPEKTVTFTNIFGTSTLPVGFDESKTGTVSLPQFREQKVASSGAWIAEDHYRLRTYLYETPYYITYDFQFADTEIAVGRELNVSFTPQTIVRIKGKME